MHDKKESKKLMFLLKSPSFVVATYAIRDVMKSG